MFEKYDATVIGGYGGGGEYEVQLGFGWSNGVIMELLAKYGDRLTANEVFGTEELVSSAQKLHLAPATQQVSTGMNRISIYFQSISIYLR